MRGVRDQINLLETDDNVFKLTDPVLIKQDLKEALIYIYADYPVKKDLVPGYEFERKSRSNARYIKCI